jgi:hypothetical protein
MKCENEFEGLSHRLHCYCHRARTAAEQWESLARFLGIDLADLMDMECRDTLRAVDKKLSLRVAAGTSGFTAAGALLSGIAISVREIGHAADSLNGAAPDGQQIPHMPFSVIEGRGAALRKLELGGFSLPVR